jgi:hypothetical protein
MKDRAKQYSSSWCQSARLITVQFSVVMCDDMVLLFARDWSTINVPSSLLMATYFSQGQIGSTQLRVGLLIEVIIVIKVLSGAVAELFVHQIGIIT